jgi:hypothetical protein
MWKHIEQSTTANIQSQLYLNVRMGMFEEGLFVEGWNTDQGSIVSSLLTNLSSYVKEFGIASESDWVSERVVTYESVHKDYVLTTRLSNNTLEHLIESCEESIECETSRQDGFCVSVESKRVADESMIPSIALPLTVTMKQTKTFTWNDRSYAHTVIPEKQRSTMEPICWKA